MNPDKKYKKPYNEENDRELFDNDFYVSSYNDCTGMVPTPPENEEELKSYSDIYDIPLAGHQKNKQG